MSGYMECEDIKEHLQDCADRLTDLGFDGMDAALYGTGPVGKAYRHLSGEDDLDVLAKYLKSVAAAFKEMNAKKPGDFYVQQAMQALDLTWKCMQECVQLPDAAKKRADEPRSVLQAQPRVIAQLPSTPMRQITGPRVARPAVPALRR